MALAAGETFGALFPIVEPIGNAATFTALTQRFSESHRRAEARRTVILAAGILLIFLAVGEPLLRFFGISLESLQIAGGLVVASTGFQMVTMIGMLDPTVREAAREDASVAFSPMAMPLLAGPGAIGVVMGLEARESGFLAFPGFAIGIVAIALLTYLCLRLGDRILSFLGPAGIDALTRIFGLLVLAIGVELIVHGIVTHGAIVALHSPG